MKLIGITGKSGSGKTTLSNMLAQQYPEIGVVHIDDILGDIKLKYFKFLMKENNKGERTKVDSKFKMFIYQNRILFNMFMKFRAKLIKKPLQQQISQLQNEGKTTVIIDDIFLQYHRCYKNLSMILQMTRPYIDRKMAVMERDGVTKEEMVAYDVAHHTGNYRDSKNVNTIKICNNGGKEELQAISQQIYEKHLIPFKTKYKVTRQRQQIKIQDRTETIQIDRKEER